jgi:hypothetical protein
MAYLRRFSTASWRLYRLLGLLLLGAAGCPPPLPDAPPQAAPATGRLLLCVGSNQEIFAELQAEFAELAIGWVADLAECGRAYAAAAVAGTACLEQEKDCHNPQFIDGKPTATSDSRYPQLLLFWSLQHGSLSLRSQKVTESTGPGPAVAAGAGQRGGRGPVGGGGRSITKVVVTPSAETGYTGELFRFDPRLGQLRGGETFRDLATAKLLDRVRALAGL